MRCWWLVLLSLGLTACSWLDSPRLATAPASTTAPEPKAIEQAVDDVVRTTKLGGQPQISMVRRANITALADWIVCLRGNTSAFQSYALFFRGDKLVDYRLAVLADDCGLESYMPVARP